MSDQWIQERIKRKTDAARACEFGIPYLDDALNGIRPTELIVIAARTGAGKTELATLIALHNARKQKRVSLFALEAEGFELERRLKYGYLSREFFLERDKYPRELSLNFCDWLHDKYGNALDALEERVDTIMRTETDTLHIYTPSVSEFRKKDFALVYEELAGEADLVILDHIHYIAPEDRENEYDHIKKTMWNLRELINRHEVPIVAVSHLRKEIKKPFPLVPSLEDIHGSSEITKQANHVISFASISRVPNPGSPSEWVAAPSGATLCKVLKTRTGHTSTDKYASLMVFDFKTKTYGEAYKPYFIDQYSSALFPMKYQQFERWMGLGRESLAGSK